MHPPESGQEARLGREEEGRINGHCYNNSNAEKT